MNGGEGIYGVDTTSRKRSLYSKAITSRNYPADLGFYDLRVPEVREAQAELARNAGIEAFCYYHYWFGGKRLLERPFQEVVTSWKTCIFLSAFAGQIRPGQEYGTVRQTAS